MVFIHRNRNFFQSKFLHAVNVSDLWERNLAFFPCAPHQFLRKSSACFLQNLSVMHNILGLCMCHTTYHCHSDWLVGIPSRVLMCLSLLWFRLVISGSGRCQPTDELGHCHRIRLPAPQLRWDFLIMLMQSKSPSVHPRPNTPHQSPQLN